MWRRRSAWLGLTGWLIASCTYTPYPAESTAAACVNAEDDDHDDRMDCDDPDCWRFAYCDPNRIVAPPGPPASPNETPIAPDDPLVPMDNQSMSDGSVPPDMPRTDAHVPDMPPDASTVQPGVCSKYCPPDQCNEDGSCKKPLVFGDYAVQSIMLSAPRMRDEECFDQRIGCTMLSSVSCCAPDPIVTIYAGAVKAGFVNPVTDTDAPTWASVDMQLTLREGDEVKFEVEDEDTLLVGDVEDPVQSGSPTVMFTCSTFVTAEMIEAGRVGCTPEGRFQPLREPYVVAFISLLGGAGVDEDTESDLP